MAIKRVETYTCDNCGACSNDHNEICQDFRVTLPLDPHNVFLRISQREDLSELYNGSPDRPLPKDLCKKCWALMLEKFVFALRGQVLIDYPGRG